MSSAKPTIVPRWEWRTFGDNLTTIRFKVIPSGEVVVRESSEIYLLYLNGSQNAKIRDDQLDVKRLNRVSDTGLELWEPVFKAAFPLTQRDIATAFQKLELRSPGMDRERYDCNQFLSEIIVARSDIHVASVKKRRRAFTYGGCISEFVELSVDSLSLESFSLEHEDPARIMAALGELNLQNVPNVNYPAALKHALQLNKYTREA